MGFPLTKTIHLGATPIYGNPHLRINSDLSSYSQLFPAFCMIHPADDHFMVTLPCAARCELCWRLHPTSSRWGPQLLGEMWVISSHIWVASSQGFLNCMENFLQVPCNYVDLCWLQKARGSASYVVQTLSRSSVKGHKSSIKEGNALYLDGLQYSNKAGWLGPWMGSAMSSWHVAFRVEVHLRRLESSRSWFRITWRKKASGSLRSGLEPCRRLLGTQGLEIGAIHLLNRAAARPRV